MIKKPMIPIIRRCSITDAALFGEITVQQVKDFIKRIVP